MTIRIMPYKSMQLFDNCSFVQNGGVLTGSAETLILASAVARVDVNCDAIVANGALYLIPGTGCTGIIIRFREGFGITGAIDWEPVGFGPPAGISVKPGVVNAIPLAAVLGPAWQQRPEGGQYTVSVQQVGANTPGNGKVLNANVSWWSATWWDIE
jgi:hypothetical protein